MEIRPFQRDVVIPVSAAPPRHTCSVHGMNEWDMMQSMAHERRENELYTLAILLGVWIIWRTACELAIVFAALVDAALVAKFAPKHTKAYGAAAFKTMARKKISASLNSALRFFDSPPIILKVLMFAQFLHDWFKTDVTIFMYYIYFEIARNLCVAVRLLWISFCNYFRRRAIIQDALSDSKAAPTCSLCYENPTDCFLNPCGHTFCTACVRQWFQSHNTCPMCVRQAECGLKMFHPCALSE